MSFVDLMSSDIWTEAAIKSRLHAEIRGEISEQAEMECNRALQGAMLGAHTLTVQEKQAIGKFKVVTERVAALGVQARSDAALLVQIMALEEASRRLKQPLTDPVDPVDEAERLAAQALLNAATPEALEWFERRNPKPVTEPEEEES